MIYIYYSFYEEDPTGQEKNTEREHRIGRELLRRGLSELYGICAENMDSMLCEGEFGKPYLRERPDISFNISHCRGLVVCAFLGQTGRNDESEHTDHIVSEGQPDQAIGIDVEAPEGNMIVDIGGGTTEIAVISLGGIVANNSIKVAGDDLTSDIQEYMSRQHNVKVSERMAERIKINVGSALTDLGEEGPEDYIVHGPNRITALPMEVPVCYQEIAHCLDKTVARIETAVLSALESTPPELYADIVHNGIYLTGGGALLRGLDKRLQDKINIPFHIAEDPLHCVAKGAGIALNNVDRFSFLMR